MDYKNNRLLSKSEVLLEEVYQNLYELCDNIGERYAGTIDEKKAADYLFQKLGEYQIHHSQIQKYPLKTWKPVSSFLEFFIDEQSFSMESLNITLTESAEAMGGLLDLTRDSWFVTTYIKDLSGNIVLIDNLTRLPFYHGAPLSLEAKASYCKEKGCIGIIVKNAVNQGRLLKWMSLKEDFKGIPCCSISFEDGERLQRLIRYREKMNVRIATKVIKGNDYSQNIIGEIKGKSNETIIIGAHYDTVIGSVGALDNACGVAVLLEVARIISNIAKKYPLEKNILFIFFGSEELGLQGSEYFVKNLQKFQKINTKFMINLDEIGTGRMKGYVLNTSSKLKSILNHLLINSGSQYLFHYCIPFEIDKSGDSYAFAKQGIETIGFWRWRYEAESSLNRYRHINYDEGESMAHHFRHTKADTLDKVDLSSLREYAWELLLLLDILLENSF